jgi:hypothetical protein
MALEKEANQLGLLTNITKTKYRHPITAKHENIREEVTYWRQRI